MNLNFRQTIITRKNYYKMNQKILNPPNCNLLKSAHFYLKVFWRRIATYNHLKFRKFYILYPEKSTFQQEF